jgi:uncharacterized protein
VRHQAQPIASDAEFELPPLDETGWTREQLLDGLKNEIELPAAVVGLATIYAREIEPDIVATFERARLEELDWPSLRLFFRGAHILGAARLTAGYRPFTALLHEPEERLEYLLGDAITETLSKILAGMFDGDAEPLLTLISDGESYEFVREAALKAFAFLALDGRTDRRTAEEFLARFEQESTAPAGDMIWWGWVSAVALLGLEQLSPRVHAAFEDGRNRPELDDEGHYRTLLAAGSASPPELTRFESERIGYIEDVVEVLEFFPDEDWEEILGEDMEGLDGRDLEWTPGMPARNLWRDVGRNDPCPCGSGKKFKKCCLPAQA